MRAVSPFWLSLAPTLASADNSALTVSRLPARAAVIKAVSPPGNAVLGSAPAFSSALTIVAFPFVQARVSGVMPYRFDALTFAPARIRRFTVSRSSWYTAQCRAVVPSTCGRFTSARFSIRARIAALSDAFAASASRVSGAAAIRLTTDKIEAIPHGPNRFRHIVVVSWFSWRVFFARFFSVVRVRSGSRRKRIQQLFHLTLTVAKSIQPDTGFIQQCQVKISERRGLSIFNMASALKIARSPAGHQHWDIHVIMHVGIAHAAAIKVHGMIQQRTGAIRRRLHLSDEIGEQLHMKRIDLGNLGKHFRITAAVRCRVMRIRQADLGIRARAGFASELKRDNARDVALECQYLQIEHQFCVIRISGGNSHRTIQIRQMVAGCLRLGLLYTALYFADGVQIFADLIAVARAELPLEAGNVCRHPV